MPGASENLLYAVITPALEQLVANDELAQQDLLAEEPQLQVAL